MCMCVFRRVSQSCCLPRRSVRPVCTNRLRRRNSCRHRRHLPPCPHPVPVLRQYIPSSPHSSRPSLSPVRAACPTGGLNPTMQFSSPLRLTVTRLSAQVLLMDGLHGGPVCVCFCLLYVCCVCVGVTHRCWISAPLMKAPSAAC